MRFPLCKPLSLLIFSQLSMYQPVHLKEPSMNRFVLAFVMLLCLIGTSLTIIAFGIGSLTGAQLIVSLAAFIFIGWVATRDL
jgi:hypothetical protein